jgi:Zn-dependent peptidase ImmA (M78 family)
MATPVEMKTNHLTIPGSLLTELQCQLGCTDIFSWLEEEADRLATLSADYSLDRVKLSREIFANRGVLSVRDCPNLSQDACVVPIAGGYQINYRRGIPKQRLRFALAHELGHTLLFKRDGSGRSLARMQNHEDPSVEVLCDFFASALLLPKSRLARKVGELCSERHTAADPPLHLIPPLAETFGVAPQAIARRLLFDVWESHRTVFSIKRNVVSKQEGWRTMWFASVATKPRQLPTGWHIPLDSNGRKLPADIVPDVPHGETSRIMVDGRVYAASTPKSPKDSRVPISRQTPKPKVEAIATFAEVPSDMFEDRVDVVIIAFP